jgi:intein/homing endonuclease
MTETDIKYLAGLLDADGSFFFNYSSGFVYLTIALDVTEGIDKDFKYITWLAEELEITPHISDRSPGKWSRGAKLTISRSTSLNKLVPRLLKYLVIKGGHLQRLKNKWLELKGMKQSEEQLSELKKFVKYSRLLTVPVRTKSWLPRAYVAGFIDGDGSYTFRTKCGRYSVSTVSHSNDRVVADLLYKQYGGRVFTDKEGYVRWVRGLGISHRSFAVPFLKVMCKHSRLKRHKIEQFLNYHSQRLNRMTPKGEAIV